MARGSPGRRKSIAVTNQNVKPAPTRRRRAYSIAPGATLSPSSKARRLLAPRKSILKASLNTATADPSVTSELTSPPDEATASMDITRTEFHTRIVDNHTARKSLGRRVSFAEHAHVRMFEVQEQNTNSTTSPQSSPSAAESPSPGEASQVVNNENDYPGALSFRRRLSVRPSLGEESMDLDLDDTAPIPESFLPDGSGPALQDEEFSQDDDEYDDDMEMTDIIGKGLLAARRRSSVAPRRRSSAAPSHRPPLAVVSASDPTVIQSNNDEEDTHNSIAHTFSESNMSEDYGEGEDQPIEYEVPLAQALNPVENDQAWLALRAITHSGDTPHSPHSSSDEEDAGGDGMELTDAVERLMKVRNSMGVSDPPHVVAELGEEDSFTSTEDSFVNADGGSGDRTVNLTGLLKRESGAGVSRMSIGRMSMGPAGAESTMDLTSVYGDQEDIAVIQAVPADKEAHVQAATPVPVTAPSRPALFQSQPAVFTAPSASRNTPSPPPSPSEIPPTPQPTISKLPQFSFTPKNQTRPKPAPGSISPAKARPSAAFAAPTSRPLPMNRSAPDNDAGSRPSPAKKLAFTDVGSSVPTPKAPSPAKKTPLQTSSSTSPAKGPMRSLRRPSGYFAQRKSLVGTGLQEKGATVDARSTTGRESMSGPWTGHMLTRFDRTQVAPLLDKGKHKDKSNEGSIPEQVVLSRPSHPPLSPPTKLSTTVDSTARAGEEQHQPEEVNHVDMQLDHEDAMVEQAMTEQWRMGVQEQDFADDNDDGPAISIEQFFAMTGIRFMDEITAPRRSTIHPSQLRPRSRAHSPSSTSPIPLSEYVTAMSVDIPQLELFTHVSQDLQAWIERCRSICAQAEEEALKITPELFREYSTADEDGQAELQHQLRLIKAHAHGVAKGEWYDWRLSWIQQLDVDAEKGFRDLESDATVIEEIMNLTQELLPALKREYEEAMQELKQEQAIVTEIEDSDQEFLNELKASIAEQNLEVEALRMEVAEGGAKSGRLHEKLEEINADKQEAKIAIDNARRQIHLKNDSTLAEVIRKKNELEALEKLHMWRATKSQGDLFEYIYESQYRVSIPCVKYRPVVNKVEVNKVDAAKTKDTFPILSSLMLRMARVQVVQLKEDVKIRTIVQCLRDYWSSCNQLRHQLKLLNIKYPVSIEILDEGQDDPTGFKATATVLFPKFKGKALISYCFNMKVLSTWPVALTSVQCDVCTAYGALDREIILKAVLQRLHQASPQDNHACLLDACMESVEAMDRTI